MVHCMEVSTAETFAMYTPFVCFVVFLLLPSCLGIRGNACDLDGTWICILAVKVYSLFSTSNAHSACFTSVLHFWYDFTSVDCTQVFVMILNFSKVYSFFVT